MSNLQKRILIVLAIFTFLLGIVWYFFMRYLNVPKSYQSSSSDIIYRCNPYFFLESRLGEAYYLDELEVNASVCKHHGYYSAVKSYSKEPTQIIVDVYFLRENGQNLYTLDHQLVGKFEKFHIKNDILKGTAHRLVYSLKGSKYELVQITKI